MSGQDTEKTISMSPEELPEPPKPKPAKRRRRGGGQQSLIYFWLPIIMGFALTFGCFIALDSLPVEGGVPGMALVRAKMIGGESSIPMTCLFLLMWHLSYLGIRFFFQIRPEMMVLDSNLIPQGNTELTDEELADMSQRAGQIIGRQRNRQHVLATRILLAVAHLGIRRDIGELGDLLRRRADTDRQRTINAYGIPNFIFWAIPILGFVGTVIGISMAVGRLKGSLKEGVGQEELVENLGQVAGNLGVAFDTTLVALLLSIFALLGMLLTRMRELHMLSQIEDYLTYRLQSRVRTETSDVRMETIMRDSMQNLTKIQEQMADDQQERASMAMQTMMSSQESLKDVLGQIPELVNKASENNDTIMGETRNRLGEVSDSLRSSVSEGFAEIRDGLESAVDKQRENIGEMTEALKGSAEKASDILSSAGEHLNRELGEITESVNEQFAEGARRIEAALSSAGEKTHSSLVEVGDKLSDALSDGRELLDLQGALRANLDQIARIQNLGQTFTQVRDSLSSLQPVLSRLSQPIPVRLTLTGVDLPDAGTNGNGNGSHDAESATYQPPDLGYGDLSEVAEESEAPPHEPEPLPAAPLPPEEGTDEVPEDAAPEQTPPTPIEAPPERLDPDSDPNPTVLFEPPADEEATEATDAEEDTEQDEDSDQVNAADESEEEAQDSDESPMAEAEEDNEEESQGSDQTPVDEVAEEEQDPNQTLMDESSIEPREPQSTTPWAQPADDDSDSSLPKTESLPKPDEIEPTTGEIPWAQGDMSAEDDEAAETDEESVDE